MSAIRIIKDDIFRLQRQEKFLFWKYWKTIDSDPIRVKDSWLQSYNMSNYLTPIISKP